jgi:hypothetical protein
MLKNTLFDISKTANVFFLFKCYQTIFRCFDSQLINLEVQKLSE